jgi:hypothetical protein
MGEFEGDIVSDSLGDEAFEAVRLVLGAVAKAFMGSAFEKSNGGELRLFETQCRRSSSCTGSGL